MAAHIGTEARLQRLRHVLRSVRNQDVQREEADFVFALSWSAASPEMADRVQRFLDEDGILASPCPPDLSTRRERLSAAHGDGCADCSAREQDFKAEGESRNCDCQIAPAGTGSETQAPTPSAQANVALAASESASSGPTMHGVRQHARHSQFQHLRAALGVAEATVRRRLQRHPAACDAAAPRSAFDSESTPSSSSTSPAPTASSTWVVFGDDDDIWHPSRVSEYVRAARSHPILPGVGVFATTARVNCRGDRKVTDAELPNSPDEVDKFLRSGRGSRMENEDACKTWRSRLRANGNQAGLLAVPDELCLEYFDLCPRLRLVKEFFRTAPDDLVRHRYCDLCFNEFLSSYTRKGKEMGLEVSFLEPRCWMLFYATPIPDTAAWQRSVEGRAGDADDASGAAVIDVNNGHMSSSVNVEPAEFELARRVLDDFRHYESGIPVGRLARYWAAFRNTLEVYFMRKVGCKMDQRLFDAFVFLAVNGSFFRFSDVVGRMAQTKIDSAARMMYYVGQGYAKVVARRLNVGVLWHKPNVFLQPPTDDERYYEVTYAPSYGYGGLGYPPGSPFGHVGVPPWKQHAPTFGAFGSYGKGGKGTNPYGKGVGKAPFSAYKPHGGAGFGLGHGIGKGGGGSGAKPWGPPIAAAQPPKAATAPWP